MYWVDDHLFCNESLVNYEVQWAFGFVDLQPIILTLPVIKRAIGYAKLTANLLNFCSSFVLLDRFDDLFF